MDALAMLAERGKVLVQEMEEEQARKRAEDQRRTEEARAFNLQALREKLQIADDEEALWEALAPRATESRYMITAYGVTGQIYQDLSGWATDAIKGRVSRMTLALFVAYAQDVRAQTKARVIEILALNDEPSMYQEQFLEAHRVEGLWDDPEVQDARINFLMRTRPTRMDSIVATNWWWTRWLDEAARLPMSYERAEVAALFERAKRWGDLDYRLRMASAEGVTGALVDGLQAEVDAWDNDAPEYWRKILATLQNTVNAEKEAEQWDVERGRLQAAAFYPFRYWWVGWGYLHEDEDGLIVETDEIPSLHIPDAEGWIVDARFGNRVQVRAITTVKEVQIHKMCEIPTWPCCWQGEGKRRYQVPPKGAERLSRGKQD